MKRDVIMSGVVALMLCTIFLNIVTDGQPQEEWMGFMRIEGKTDTIWCGEVTVGETIITALNESSGQMEEYYIPYPSVLGALDAASKEAGFTYTVTYYPSWHAFFVTSIGDDSDWWHYWVDYNLPMVDAGSYKLTEDDREILWGYVEDWYAHALRINVDKTDIHKNEAVHVNVFNETMEPVGNATIYMDSQTYTTDENGSLTIRLSNKGDYTLYAEKNGYVRSEKITVHVKIFNIFYRQPIIRYIFNLLHLHSFSNITS